MSSRTRGSPRCSTSCAAEAREAPDLAAHRARCDGASTLRGGGDGLADAYAVTAALPERAQVGEARELLGALRGGQADELRPDARSHQHLRLAREALVRPRPQDGRRARLRAARGLVSGDLERRGVRRRRTRGTLQSGKSRRLGLLRWPPTPCNPPDDRGYVLVAASARQAVGVRHARATHAEAGHWTDPIGVLRSSPTLSRAPDSAPTH